MTGVPLDELNHYLSMLESVTPEEARATAHRYIEGERPIIVVVGNAATLRPQLESLGTVVVVDNQGNVMK